ncbi:ComF family protein [Alkalihalobacillus sp. AL-G]|uniref:ComF family protein n=1 Tax=Alkalihalobacillus sp. AL-G TaxID=2926399 RepID=UPI00272D19B9|nr:ComF family protein [Alkalihalobacillus sp. AL-G]WLD92979.1 ComF family protein [Alkalihalobacillus sp. AL-G]
MNCLSCHEPIQIKFGWNDLFYLNDPSSICSACSDQLERIEGEICRMCGRSFSIFPEQYRQDDCCFDCLEWEQHGSSITKNRSLYQYNPFLKEVMARFKYRGDAELVKLFQKELQALVKRAFKGTIVVPIPLSKERHYERGFNQAELVAGMIGCPYYHALKRPVHEEKQSKKSKRERLEHATVFTMNEEFRSAIANSDVTIVDDLYTTGATVQAAGKILLDHGARTVSSLTIARG